MSAIRAICVQININPMHFCKIFLGISWANTLFSEENEPYESIEGLEMLYEFAFLSKCS